jgi:decaprenylphospho-beta-D-erythro-pentofuranosid-2-ulose 2-reductase
VLLADRMKKQGHGQIVVFSSVAGEMVRRSNFVYGSTKAGVDGIYRMLGEAQRGTGVRVLTVRPGQVRTNMTKGLDDAPLTVDKEDAAKAIAAGVDGKKTVIWIHPLFRWVMLILKNLPQFVVRKLPI